MYLSSNRIRATTVDINVRPTSSSIYFIKLRMCVCNNTHIKVFSFREKRGEEETFPQMRNLFFSTHIFVAFLKEEKRNCYRKLNWQNLCARVKRENVYGDYESYPWSLFFILLIINIVPDKGCITWVKKILLNS